MNEGAQNMNIQVAAWYETFRQELLLVGYRLGYSGEELNDLLHQFFLDIMEKHIDFSKINTPRSYLQTAFRRKLIDHHRSQKRQANKATLYVVQDDYEPSVQEIIEQIQSDKALIEKVIMICDKMPNTVKLVISLKYGEGLTNEQIQQITGLSRRTVYNSLFKGIKQLRRELQDTPKTTFFILLPLALQAGRFFFENGSGI